MASVFADTLDSSARPTACICLSLCLHRVLAPISNAMSMLVISMVALVSAGALVVELENHGDRSRNYTLRYAAGMLARQDLSDPQRLALLESWSTKEPWNTEEGIYYMFSLFSNIGHGKYSPVTGAGRCISTVFIVLVVPVGILHMQCLASVYQSILSRVMIHCRERLGRHRRLVRLIFPNDDNTIVVIPATVITVVLNLHLLAAVPFLCVMESWTPMESLYFLISAATTIGFGDLHTGPHSLPYVLAAVTFQLHLCACFALVINYLNDALEWMLQSYFANVQDPEADATRDSVGWRPSLF